jgi:hypothetical protein
MKTIKEFTDLWQSMKLANILPLKLESADMTLKREINKISKEIEWIPTIGLDVAIKDNLFSFRNGYVYPCWSLAALLEQIPERLRDKDGLYYDLEITKNSDLYSVYYYNEDEGRFYYVSCKDTLVDACYEMILKLNDLNLL